MYPRTPLNSNANPLPNPLPHLPPNQPIPPHVYQLFAHLFGSVQPPAPEPAAAHAPHNDMHQRIDALERELKALKTQNTRTADQNEQPGTKRARRGQPAKAAKVYILKGPVKGLRPAQVVVRNELMKLVKSEVKQLVAPRDDDADDADDEGTGPTRQRFCFNFSENVDSVSNNRVIVRAAQLVLTEQSPQAATCTLSHKDVEFTKDDLEYFAKSTFRTMRESWKADTDPTVAKRKAGYAANSTLILRQRQLKDKRIALIPSYLKKFPGRANPAPLLKTDWMTDLVNGLSTSDEDECRQHLEKLWEAAGLGANPNGLNVWERLRPAFQTPEFAQIKDDIDGSAPKLKKKGPGPSATIRANLGRTHDRVPASPVYPFIMRQIWHDIHIAGDKTLKKSFTVYAADLPGFVAFDGLLPGGVSSPEEEEEQR
ncbi:hypothetical protein MKEN_01466800 [Mycena kentingensis (nom. inval.)]|nr:hypothetical protein MKEN_01466800 [Mycena kentingensis (nom. inval.)]